MGEFTPEKQDSSSQLQRCFLCETDIKAGDEISAFYNFSSNGVLLASLIERNLLLKNISNVPNRSTVLCHSCFDIFEQLTESQSKVDQLKNTLWSMYKSSLERQQLEIVDLINGIATQTDNPLSDLCLVENHQFKVETSGLELNDKTNEEGDDFPAVKAETKKGRKTVKCKLCNETFSSPQLLKTHLKTHEYLNENVEDNSNETIKVRKGKRKNKCENCGRLFRLRSALAKHLEKYEKSNWKCKHCDMVCRSADAAKDHLSNIHEINTSIVENFNLSSFANSDDSSSDEIPLSKHRKQLIFDKIKKEIHNEGQKSKQVNQEEALRVLQESGCVQITKISATNSVQSDFIEEHLESLDEFYVENNEGGDNLLSHIKDGEVRRRISELSKANAVTVNCNSETEVAAKLNAKRRTKRNAPIKSDQREFLPPIKEPKFKCNICGKLWKTRGELNAHVNTHSDARPFICEICGQAYKHKQALDVHVGMHNGIYRHQCSYCKKAFTQKGALQRHLPIHTGDMPYQCELCGKRFVHRTSFSIHSMAHTGVRNIKCEICNLGVLSKSHLRRHMRIHSGEKPYECPTCGKAFAERYNLAAHQRIHDPATANANKQKRKNHVQCSLCNALFSTKGNRLEHHMITAHHKMEEDDKMYVRESVLTLAPDGYTRFAEPHEVSGIVIKNLDIPTVDLSVRASQAIRTVDGSHWHYG